MICTLIKQYLYLEILNIVIFNLHQYLIRAKYEFRRFRYLLIYFLHAIDSCLLNTVYYGRNSCLSELFPAMD